MIEPKTPSNSDSIIKVLKSVESPMQRATPNSVFKNGKFVPYTGGKVYVQEVYTYVIFSNDSIASKRIYNDLPEEEKDNFFKVGYFVKTESGWDEITKEEFWKELNKAESFIKK